MIKPVIIGVYGYSNSGKTTLITSLISHFSEKGYKVGAMKQTNKEISIDSKGKDTYLFSSAGAEPIIFSSPSGTTLLKKQLVPLSIILESYIFSEQIDLFLIEGATDSLIEKIRIGKRPLRENTIYTFKDNLDELIQIIKNKLERRNNEMGDQVEIKVNDKKIPLSAFPKDIIMHTIKGLVETLKGVDPPVKSIQITIEIES